MFFGLELVTVSSFRGLICAQASTSRHGAVQPNWTNSGDSRSLLVFGKKLNHYECVEGQHTEERGEIK